MKIGIAFEMCSFPVKDQVIDFIKELGHEVVDMGMQSEDKKWAFYETAPVVAKAIQKGEVDRGILFCGTGNGVNIIANKYKGVYAGLAESVSTAKRHRIINRCNVLCMGAWVVAPMIMCDMIGAFLSAEIGEGFSEERKQIQADGFARILEYENENFK